MPIVHTGDIRHACNILFRKQRGKKLTKRLRHRWEHHLKVDQKEILYEKVDWINVVWIQKSNFRCHNGWVDEWK
jgi:hypothetical protein